MHTNALAENSCRALGPRILLLPAQIQGLKLPKPSVTLPLNRDWLFQGEAPELEAAWEGRSRMALAQPPPQDAHGEKGWSRYAAVSQGQCLGALDSQHGQTEPCWPHL